MGIIGKIAWKIAGKQKRKLAEKLYSKARGTLYKVSANNIRLASNARFVGLQDHFKDDNYYTMIEKNFLKFIKAVHDVFYGFTLPESTEHGRAHRLIFELSCIGYTAVGLIFDSVTHKYYVAVTVLDKFGSAENEYKVLGINPENLEVIDPADPNFNGTKGYILW